MSDSKLPGPGYEAALRGAAVGPSSERAFLLVTGKAPGEMLNGLLSNSLPSPLEEAGDGDGGGGRAPGPEARRLRGRVVYSALLNDKGKMITDLRVFSDLEGGFLLEVPAAGLDGAAAHFRKFLPPRLAVVEDRSSRTDGFTVFGPKAPGFLASFLQAFGSALTPEAIVALDEGDELILLFPDRGEFRLVGNGGFSGPAWDLVLPAEVSEVAREALGEMGAAPVSGLEQEILRIEKGRPIFGKDMDQNTLPVEAGIQGRAIDYGKGCYTGQEVVIRIRDRGRVNKELRGLLLGTAPAADAGQELFDPGREKSVGWVTSSVASPRFGQTIALGYLKRSVVPGNTVRLGKADGPEARVTALTDEGWVLD